MGTVTAPHNAQPEASKAYDQGLRPQSQKIIPQRCCKNNIITFTTKLQAKGLQPRELVKFYVKKTEKLKIKDSG